MRYCKSPAGNRTASDERSARSRRNTVPHRIAMSPPGNFIEGLPFSRAPPCSQSSHHKLPCKDSRRGGGVQAPPPRRLSVFDCDPVIGFENHDPSVRQRKGLENGAGGKEPSFRAVISRASQSVKLNGPQKYSVFFGSPLC